jgi:predicted amidohydrolase
MRLALMQSRPMKTMDDALTRLAEEAQRACQNGADLLITPEMFLSGYNIGVDAVGDAAAALDVGRVCDIARQYGIALLVGGPERVSKALYNTIYLIDSGGTLRSSYQKTHLYGDVDRSQFTAGEALSEVVTLDGWKLGMAICYDVEFPELTRALAAKGADVILVPTANMRPYDTVCTRLVPARAQENGVYIAYVNYVGREDPFEYCGLSCLCDPTGADVVRADGTGEVTLYADLSHPKLRATQHEITYLSDRRTDLY